MKATARAGFHAGTVYLLGTGLIGGSLALDLKRLGLADRILGSDLVRESEEEALRKGILDDAAHPDEDVLRACEIVVLAVPVLDIATVLSRGFPQGPLVTDVGSVKAPLVRAWRQAAEAGHPFRYVPGHPIAGDERSGPGAARPGLFNGARVVLTPGGGADEDLRIVEGMWRAVGASVTTMDPDRHDEIFAWVSHLPHMAAFAIVGAVVEKDPSWIALSGGGLKDYTRVAASSPRMWADIAIANRGPLLEALGGLQGETRSIYEAVERGDREALERLFQKVAGVRRGM